MPRTTTTKSSNTKREFLYSPEENKLAWEAYDTLRGEYDYDFSWVEDVEELHGIEMELLRMVAKWPDFFMGYAELWQFYSMFTGEVSKDQAEMCLKEAWKMTDKILLDENGNWPDVIDWAWLENRTVIRVLIAGVIRKWKNGMPALARVTFRNLLRTNPNDNPGARFFILAINEGMSYKTYQRKFENNNGSLKPEISEWFETESKKYPDEFAVWEKAVAEMV